jgi:hypothetical protein
MDQQSQYPLDLCEMQNLSHPLEPPTESETWKVEFSILVILIYCHFENPLKILFFTLQNLLYITGLME